MSNARMWCGAFFVSLLTTGCFQPSTDDDVAMSEEDTDTADASDGGDALPDEDDGAEPIPVDDGADLPLMHAEVDVDGLGTLSAGFHYEGWAIIDGAPVSIGKFNVDASGVITDLDGIAIPNGRLAAGRDLRVASDFVLTIETPGDVDITPSPVKYLAGPLDGDAVTLSVADAFGDDFAAAEGKFILATPTDGPNNNETSGLWFLDLSSEPAAPGLVLPVLPAGWVYEGWVVVDGTPISTGRFDAGDAADFDAPFSGELDSPDVPGEDFLVEAPSGWTFPLSLRAQLTVVSIEPDDDDSPAPFALKPLVGEIPDDAATHHSFAMENLFLELPTITIALVP